MKIRFHTMLGTLHSWSLVSTYLAREMDKLGHEIHLKSTNSLKHFPDDLKRLLLPGYHNIPQKGSAELVEYLKKDGEIEMVSFNKLLPEIEDKNRPYDIEYAYTIPFQFCRRFFPESKSRVCIWNFESSIMPPGWHLYVRSIDWLLPSSQYSYDIFASNGVPKDKMLVVPHGIDSNIFGPNIPPLKLKTNKKVKFLFNAICHARKLHDRVFRAYFDAFTEKDDVCLVLKTKFLTPSDPFTKPFEVNVKELLEKEMRGRKNLPEVEIINDVFIENIGSLYTACDCVVCMSSTEGFCLPLLEALACNSLVIAPRHGGQLDFLNDSNSLLVNTKEMLAPMTHQYWEANPKAVVGDPDTRHCSELMRYVYENLDKEKARVKDASRQTVEKFTWKRAAETILNLPIPSPNLRIPKKRKVLYIIPYNVAGGAEYWVKEAIKKLDKNIYEPHIALISGGSNGLFDLFKDLGVTIEDLSNQGCGAGLKCLVESENYAIIHFYNSFSVYMALRAAWGQGYRCRIVETVHSDLIWPDSMAKVSTRDKLICAISTISNQMGSKLLKSGNKNVIMLPQQIDWNRFRIDRSKNILKEMGIPKDFVVGFVGRISPEKNIPMILKCASKFTDMSFVIVGDGPQKSALMALAPKNVFFIGQRNDVEKFYSAFDILILPSFVEGVPLVILEAMTAGTPAVASNVGAINEIIKNGENGKLCDPSNLESFMDAIEEIKNMDNWNRYSLKCGEISNNIENITKNMDINYFYKMLF